MARFKHAGVNPPTTFGICATMLFGWRVDWVGLSDLAQPWLTKGGQPYLEARAAKPWVFQQRNERDGIYKMLWEPFECVDLDANAKTDALLKQRIEVVQSFMRTLKSRRRRLRSTPITFTSSSAPSFTIFIQAVFEGFYHLGMIRQP